METVVVSMTAHTLKKLISVKYPIKLWTNNCLLINPPKYSFIQKNVFVVH